MLLLRPHAQIRDTGGRCIYGRTMLDKTTMALVPSPMSPARGSGANTALQDAGLPCGLLATSSPAALTGAIGTYEQRSQWTPQHPRTAHTRAPLPDTARRISDRALRRALGGYWSFNVRRMGPGS